MTTAITNPTTSNLAYSGPGANSALSVLGDPIRAKFKAHAGVQLTLLTTEGDVVTISGRSSLRMSYGGYDRHGRYADADTTTLRASFNQQLSLSVQGTLSDQELADIDHLLGTIEDVFNQAMTGLSEEMGGTGLSLGTLDGLDSISAVTGSLTYSSKLSATYHVPASPPTDPSATEVTTAPSSDSAENTGMSSVADAFIRVRSSYRVTQQIALYQLVAAQAPVPEPAAPLAGPATAATPATAVSSTDAAPVSGTTTPPVATATKPAEDTSAPVAAPAPSTPMVNIRPVDAVAHAAASQIVAAMNVARNMTSGLFDTVTQFLDALVGQTADQAGTDSVSLYLAQSIRIRVVQQLTVQTPPATPASETEGESSGTPPEPATATPSNHPVNGASA